jgi:predicted DCC family thiol-disulfide oxidoreductase YuxK
MIDLYYDGLCLLCRRAVRFLKRIDNRDAIALHDSNAFLATARPEFLKNADLDTAMYAWDGTTLYRGYDAFAAAFRRIPRWSLLGTAMGWPFVRVFGLPIYALVARHRRRLGCRIEPA